MKTLVSEPEPTMRPDRSQIKLASQFPCATLLESSGWQCALPSAIKPVLASTKLCGPGLTVMCSAGDNLWLHRAIYAAKPGDILIVNTNGHYEAGYWGEVMTRAATERKLGGVVVDGCVRDRERLAEIKFPVFSRGFCLRGTKKDKLTRGGINLVISIGEVVINPGDLVAGDPDGVVVIPKSILEETLRQARAREDRERRIIHDLRRGLRTLDLLGLD
jgi:4-hydroxy-4-methyl-2-oxoglutarate aldolase